MSGRIINADVLPRLKGFVVVERFHRDWKIDWDIIHPTREAALSYLEEWRYEGDETDRVICEVDAPLSIVAELLTASTIETWKTERPERTLFAEHEG